MSVMEFFARKSSRIDVLLQCNYGTYVSCYVSDISLEGCLLDADAIGDAVVGICSVKDGKFYDESGKGWLFAIPVHAVVAQLKDHLVMCQNDLCTDDIRTWSNYQFGMNDLIELVDGVD